MLRVIVLWACLLFFSHMFLSKTGGIEIVTMPGEIMGLSIITLFASFIQWLFWTNKIRRYRFSITFLVCSVILFGIIKFLPGYQIVDLNKVIVFMCLVAFSSVLFGVIISKIGGSKM